MSDDELNPEFLIQRRKKSPYEQGMIAFKSGEGEGDNPYEKQTEEDEFKQWASGYDCQKQIGQRHEGISLE